MKHSVKAGLLLFFFLVVACKECPEKQQAVHAQGQAIAQKSHDIALLRKHFETPDENYVLVAAHRGDWRHFPENSLLAIQGAIDMGVDIVEIDIRKTKDNQLVLIHDKTIDRTMTGKGKVSDYTLDELKAMQLRNGMGLPVNFKIPTLEEAMLLAKGKILVNLDKCYDYFDQAFEILKKTGTINQVIMKGTAPAKDVKESFGKYLDKVYYMPIVHLGKGKNSSKSVDAYLSLLESPAFEFVVGETAPDYINEVKNLRKKGARIWVNSLWPSHNAGHDDNKAVLDASIYDWFIDLGINMIQTDRPHLLLEYLRKKGLHD